MTNIAPADTARASSEQGSASAEEVYAEINKETANLLGGSDRIIFAPAEDFEYTAPLEDFKQSLEQGTR